MAEMPHDPLVDRKVSQKTYSIPKSEDADFDFFNKNRENWKGNQQLMLTPIGQDTPLLVRALTPVQLGIAPTLWFVEN